MIRLGDKSTYCFEVKTKRIHLPRIYINNVQEVRKLLTLLQKHGSLTQDKMTEETTRVRAENPREFYQLLWELNLGVDVTAEGRNIVFVKNAELNSILGLDDVKLKEQILEKLTFFIPFVAILDKLIEYKNTNKKFTQQDITNDFHVSRTKGNLDNTHPLLRWANDEDWGLVDVKRKCITQKGIEYTKNAKNIRIDYVNYKVDLDENEKWNIVTHILAKYADEEQDISTLEDKINLGHVTISTAEIYSILNELKRKGLSITLDKETKIVHIANKIILNITAKNYVKYGLNRIDKIKIPESDSSEKEEIDDSSIKENLIITDEEIDTTIYPDESFVCSYEQFENISYNLPHLKIKTIILPSLWKPKKVFRIIGDLMAFVRFGGNLIVENINTPGRVGANNNRYAWLPYDLARISSVPIDDPIIKGYFTFNEEENFTFTQKIMHEKLNETNNRYYILMMKYYLGKIIFTTLKNPKELISRTTNNTDEIKIDTDSVQWKEREILYLKRLPHVNSERDLYPLLQQAMETHFNFKFDSNITGASGQTDLMIVKPFFCFCEVSTFGTNTTGGEKIGEVTRHRQTAILKDRKSKSMKYKDSEVGAIVIGFSFTLEDGEDKAGAVDSAEAQKVSLVTYMDLYELMCLNENVTLDIDDFKKVFFYQNNQPIASVRLYDLMKSKMNDYEQDN